MAGMLVGMDIMPNTQVLPYSVMDVFAERALEGNPLAVFHDARGLSTEQMQAIAREMNLSETTFVMPPDSPEEAAQGVRVRIFTTEEELPFAGHPTLGTASWLHMNLPLTRGHREVTLALDVGPIPVSFEAAGKDGAAGVFATMRQRDPEFGPEHDGAEVAGIIGLETEDLLPGHPPQTVSTGNAFCIVALRSVEALERLAIPRARSTEWLKSRSIRWFYVIAPVEGAEHRWRARMQFYNGEDPATGSAAGPCIAWLVRRGLVPSGVTTELLQGVEIHRPSRLVVSATLQNGTLPPQVTDVLVGGRTIPVAAGRLFLPCER
jgi:trans-2,3-dihydro-3-hydroxyanthranilate isomerase